MFNQQLFEFFTTTIPQSFAIILLFFSFVGIKVKAKSFVLFSFVIASVLFVVRPYVNFGVHSTISMFLLVIIAVMWGKVNIITSVIFSVMTFVIAYICEVLAFLYLNIIKFDINILENDAVIRTIIGYIPIYLLFSIGIIIYKIKKNKKQKKEVSEDAFVRENI